MLIVDTAFCNQFSITAYDGDTVDAHVVEAMCHNKLTPTRCIITPSSESSTIRDECFVFTQNVMTQAGNGLHLHISFRDVGDKLNNNAFADHSQPSGISLRGQVS